MITPPRPKLPTLAFALLVALSAGEMAQPVAGQEAASVGGRVVQDTDGDGQVSDADIGASLPIYLQDVSASEDTVPPGVHSDIDGRFSFRFTDVPSAAYRLWVAWTPGFIEPEARIDPSLEIDLSIDGLVRIVLPSERIAAGDFQDLVFLVHPAIPGIVPFPVLTGQESLPVGTATVTVQDSALPDTGTGGAHSAVPWPVVALVTLAVAGMLGVAVALGGRKGRISAR